MKPLRVALRVVSCQRANAMITGNVMRETEWATFRRSERRWPRRCWPQCVVANEGHVAVSSQVSEWSGIRRIRAEHVTESVWTEHEPPKSSQSSETRGGLSVPIWIESARVRDVCCGRTPSCGWRPWRLSHAGRTVTFSHRGLPMCSKEWPKSCLRAPLYCVHPTVCWLGRFQRSGHTRSQGCAARKSPRIGQEGSIDGSDPQTGTFECVFVHLCGCPLLLWTLQAAEIVEALTALEEGWLQNPALARQCMNVDAGFHSPTSSPTVAAPPTIALPHTQPPTPGQPRGRTLPPRPPEHPHQSAAARGARLPTTRAPSPLACLRRPPTRRARHSPQVSVPLSHNARTTQRLGLGPQFATGSGGPLRTVDHTGQ